MRGYIAALLLLGSCTGAAAQSIEEDQRWIERYLESTPKRALQRAASGGESLSFEQLRGKLGHPIRVQLRDGRARRGVLERFDGHTAQLGMIINGGKFAFKIERSQVLRIEAESGR